MMVMVVVVDTSFIFKSSKIFIQQQNQATREDTKTRHTIAVFVWHVIVCGRRRRVDQCLKQNLNWKSLGTLALAS